MSKLLSRGIGGIADVGQRLLRIKPQVFFESARQFRQGGLRPRGKREHVPWPRTGVILFRLTYPGRRLAQCIETREKDRALVPISLEASGYGAFATQVM